MKLRYRYRIYPNREQVRRLAQLFGCARVVWNDALALSQEIYKQGGKYPGGASLMKQVVTQAKQTVERSWLASVSVVPLQQSVRDLDTAFRNFFNSVADKRKGPKVSMPRFKKRHSAQSVRFTTRGFRCRVNGKLYLAKVGDVKVKWSRNTNSLKSCISQSCVEPVPAR